MPSVKTKKFIAALGVFFAAALLLQLRVFAAVGIIDRDSALSESEYLELYSYAEDIARKTGWNIAVEFDPDGDFSSAKDARNHCVAAFERTYGSDADGIYFYCADHYVYLITSGAAYHYISDSEAGRVVRHGDDIYELNRVKSMQLVLDGVYKEYTKGREIITAEMIWPMFFAGVIGGVIFIVIVMLRYRTHETPSSTQYISNDSAHFTVMKDIFIREYTTTHTEGSGSGGHSGGGHSGGGGRR